MTRVTFSTQQQQVTVRIICNIGDLDKHYFPNDLFCCCRLENVARIILHTPMFARLQGPRVLAGRNSNDQRDTQLLTCMKFCPAGLLTIINIPADSCIYITEVRS
jgi:hypothetical protein